MSIRKISYTSPSSVVRRPRSVVSHGCVATINDYGLQTSDYGLVSHGVEHDVDTQSVAVGRELVEVAGVFAFALPRIRDVGVVRADHHDVALGVGDRPDPGNGAV